MNQREPLPIISKYVDPVINLALDTISLDKQALVFVSSKRAAESQAEKIALKQKIGSPACAELAEKARKALPKPTKQCERLARCLQKGIAFHHAGLHAKQRELVETAFREGNIAIICCTPTLAYGLNLPAFRTIVRDLKRYGYRGMMDIPVLEYHQYIGRSGRPDFNDTYGEAITLADTESAEENIVEKYIQGESEPLYSKLAVEPVLRTYVLSLLATSFVQDKQGLLDFFADTFYGHQFGDMQQLEKILDKIVHQLQQWEFVEGSVQDDFVSAQDIAQPAHAKLVATKLGERVSELYLDPYTAHHMLHLLEKASLQKQTHIFGFLAMLAGCLELRPLLSVRMSEIEYVEEQLNKLHEYLLVKEPNVYSEEYDEFLHLFKTALFMYAWVNEVGEEELLEQFGIRPGETHVKLDKADWLIYSAIELARLKNLRLVVPLLLKTRMRLKHGVTEELLPLLRLKGIGRVRARTLFKHTLRDVGSIKKVDVTSLAQLVGKALAISLKEQVGEKVDPASVLISPAKRKGQMSLHKY